MILKIQIIGTLNKNTNNKLDDNDTKIDKLNNDDGNKEHNEHENEDIDEDEDDEIVIKQIENELLNDKQDEDEDDDLKLEQIGGDRINIYIHYGMDTKNPMKYSIPRDKKLWTQQLLIDMVKAAIIHYKIAKNVMLFLTVILNHVKSSKRKLKKHQSSAISCFDDIIHYLNSKEYDLDEDNINICIITNKKELQFSLFRIKTDITSKDDETKETFYNCSICVKQGKNGNDLRNYTNARSLNDHLMNYHLGMNCKQRVKAGDRGSSHRGRWQRMRDDKIKCLITNCGKIWDDYMGYQSNCYQNHKQYWSQR